MTKKTGSRNEASGKYEYETKSSNNLPEAALGPVFKDLTLLSVVTMRYTEATTFLRLIRTLNRIQTGHPFRRYLQDFLPVILFASAKSVSGSSSVVLLGYLHIS